MRRIVLQGFGLENLKIEECPTPAPGPGQVLVRVQAVSLNFRDHLFVAGQYDRRAALPAVPVSDCAGTVAAVGPGVEGLRVGDRVVNVFMEGWPAGAARPQFFTGGRGGGTHDGVLAEYVVFDETALLPVPDHLSFSEAACLACAGVTAWNAIFGGTRKPGDTVVIQGTGGVALFALQFAGLAGARTALLSSSDEKLAAVADLGADVTMNYRETPEWAGPVRAALAEDGVDLVVELGGEATLAQSLRCVRAGGTIALIGVLSGATASLNLPLVVMRQVRLQGVTAGSRADMADMLAAISAHRLRPRIHASFAFDDFASAFTMLAGAGHVGKIVIDFAKA